jgi:hypothetical protein
MGTMSMRHETKTTERGMTMKIQDINISENSVFATSGTLITDDDGSCEITDAPGVLGNDDIWAEAYAAIEAAIDAGESSAEIDGYTWTWSVEPPEPREVNEQGMKEIREFLVANHKDGGEVTDESVLAYAAEAEEHMAAGNPPTIEIKSYESVRGHTQELAISPEGVE